MSDIWKLTPEETLAEELVDEALAKMDIPPSLRPAIRVTLIGELLVTAEGKEKLRRLLKVDPVVARSGEVVKPGAKLDDVQAQTPDPKRIKQS